jgi:hypothetical protein
MGKQVKQAYITVPRMDYFRRYVSSGFGSRPHLVNLFQSQLERG